MSARVGILGGTGTAGRAVARELAARGGTVVVLSRRGERPVDVTRPDGLPAALAGLDTVVDALNGPSRNAAPVLVDGLRNVVAAAAQVGVGHLVSLSIVGIERVPVAYYRTKVAQEAVVRGGAVPATIVRATQFHDLIGAAFAFAARYGVLPTGRLPLQPVDVRDVAAVVADIVEAGPGRDRHAVAGPEILRLRELAAIWSAARGVRRLPVPLPALGPLRAVARGALVDPSARRGTRTFAEWCAS
jgi:uncharacterized protein YbjT (DUF2867 family)